MQSDLLQAHVGTYEGGKLLRGYFSKTLKSGYLGVGTQLCDGVQPLLLAIAITGNEIRLLCLWLGSFGGQHLLVLNLRALVAHSE